MFLRTRAFSLCCLIAGSAFLLSCTAGVPEIQNMGSLGGFSVDQSKVAGKNFQLTGVCSSQYSSIELSSDNGVTWQKAENLSTNFSLSCSNSGRFTGDFQFATMYPSFLVRGIASLGASESFVVAMEAQTPHRHEMIVPATGTQSGGTYKLSGTVAHDNRTATVSGGAFKIKGSLGAQ